MRWFHPNQSPITHSRTLGKYTSLQLTLFIHSCIRWPHRGSTLQGLHLFPQHQIWTVQPTLLHWSVWRSSDTQTFISWWWRNKLTVHFYSLEKVTKYFTRMESGLAPFATWNLMSHPTQHRWFRNFGTEVGNHHHGSEWKKSFTTK